MTGRGELSADVESQILGEKMGGKSSLCLIQRRGMKACAGRGEIMCVLEGGKWSGPRYGRFVHGK